jgi:hypothetical protein
MHPDLGQPDPQSQPQRQWANKYRSPEELERGYTELQTVSNQTYQRLQDLEQRFASIERVNPADQMASRRDPLEALNEVGVPADAIMELVNRGVQNYIQPMMRAQDARQTVSNEYPDFEQHENNVANYLNGNPPLKQRYERMFQVDPTGAMEWAFQTYQRKAQAPDQGIPDQSRREAALPQSFGSPDRNSGSDAAKSEELTKRWEHAQRTGNWDQYLTARLELPESHFEPYKYR